jgi:hypothetical protein
MEKLTVTILKNDLKQTFQKWSISTSITTTTTTTTTAAAAAAIYVTKYEAVKERPPSRNHTESLQNFRVYF